MDKEKNTKVIIGVVVLVVVLIIGWVVVTSGHGSAGGNPNATSTSSTSSSTAVSGAGSAATSSTASDTSMPEGGSLEVQNQPAGSSVVIALVTLSQTGWVAIRDSNGSVLGAGRFGAGTHTDVTVSLLRDTVPGGQYQALIYTDNPSGTFDLKQNLLVTNPDGSVAGTAFTTSSGE
jgi:hypothetical protein